MIDEKKKKTTASVAGGGLAKDGMDKSPGVNRERG